MMNSSQLSTGDLQVVVQPQVISLSQLMEKDFVELKIMNPLTHPIDYKLRCNSSEYYSASKSSGTIAPQCSVALRIVLKPGYKKNEGDVHKFLIKVTHNQLAGKKVIFIEDDVTLPKHPIDTLEKGVTSVVKMREEQKGLVRSSATPPDRHNLFLKSVLGFLFSLALPGLLLWDGDDVSMRIVLSYCAGIALGVILLR